MDISFVARCGGFVFSSKLLADPDEDRIQSVIENYYEVHLQHCPRFGSIDIRVNGVLVEESIS